MKLSKDSKTYIAGHTGLIGSAILAELHSRGFTDLLFRTHLELDLTRQEAVEDFFRRERPELVFLTAARVGGIKANSTFPADFIYENLAIQTNIIHSAYVSGVKKLLFLGSSCSYPRESPQPMKEHYLLSGYLEPTSEPYAVAKIAGMKMCQAYDQQYGTDFISVIPTNVYGPGDKFDQAQSHVIPSLMVRLHEAKIKGEAEMAIWGTGSPRREFIYVSDVADACIFLMENYSGPEILNIGTDEEVSVAELAHLIKEVVGFQGKIVFDTSKPDGAPRKALNTARLNNLGWRAKISLAEGLKLTYDWYLKHHSS